MMAEPHAKRVFISYARVDGDDFARELHRRLREADFDPWLDVFDISAGGDWNREIDQALAGSTAVLVVLTPGAVISHQVTSEWNAVLTCLPVIPLLARPCDVPRALNVLNILDFTRDAAAITRLFDQLRELPERHLNYLRDNLNALRAAQGAAEEPKRFEGKIDALERTIDSWTSRFQAQRGRVLAGLEEERQASEDRRQVRDLGRQVAVAGRRPLDVTDLFKDRLRECEELGEVLAGGRYRVTSVLGRGGIGKTALACKVLRDLEHSRWPHTDSGPPVDGIVYLSTRTQGINLERLFFDCARMLGGKRGEQITRIWTTPEREFPLEQKIGRLLETLSDGLHVIFLDNVEDLLDSDGFCRDLEVETLFRTLVQCPHRVRFLLTSREPVELSDGLLRPHDKHIPLLEGLPRADAIALLREFDPNGTCGLNDASDSQLVKIAELTHGVPRALELVASIMANNVILPLDELLGTFYRQDEVVRKLVEENYRRLDILARKVLSALAVFSRPVKPVAVDFLLEAVAPGTDVPSILRNLVRTHAVNADRRTGEVDLHPIDREFAYRQIEEVGVFSGRSLHRRAAEYYRSQRATIDGRWTTIDDLEPQLCEFEHLFRAEQFDDAALLLGEFGVDFAWRGNPRLCRAMLDRLHGRLTDPWARHHYHACAVTLAAILGPLADGLRHSAERLRLARDLGNRMLEAFAHWGFTTIYRYTEQPDLAIAEAEEAVKIFRELGSEEYEVYFMNEISFANSYRLNVAEALKWGGESLTIAEKRNDANSKAMAHDALSLAYSTWGRWELAIEHAQQAVAFWGKPQGDAYAYALNIQGVAHFQLGQVEDAIRTLLDARSAAIEVESPRAEGFTLHNLSVISYLNTQWSTSEAYALSARQSLAGLGLSGATDALIRILSAAQKGDGPREAQALLDCARASARNPDLFPAVRLVERSREIAQACGQLVLDEQALSFAKELSSRLISPEAFC
jgi:tetratricopeptide (TPR) repeat protein